MQRLRSHTPLTAAVALAALAACGGGSPAEPQDLPPLPEVVAREVGPAVAGEVRPQRELMIALTGDLRGEIEPCGCPTLPYGGFERRQRLLERLRWSEAVFQLDAGELLTKGASTWRADRDERARVILKASAEVGVDVWVPGPSDLLSLPIEELRRTTAPPAISATWADADGELFFPPAVVLERAGRRLGVIGLSAAPQAPELDGMVVSRDLVEAARSALATLPADLDLVVALGSVDDADADRVAAEVPGIAALLTTSGQSYDDVRVVGGVPIFETPDRGRFVQALTMHLGSTPDRPLELRPDASSWRTLMAMRGQDAASPTRQRAEAGLVALAAGRNLAWMDSRPLAEDLDGPTSVSETLGAFKEQTLVRATERAAAPTEPGEAGYATASACTTCHLDEFARWSFSDHAKAWQSLVVREATDNAECLPCHTTAFGQPGGLGELSQTNVRAFKDVQCEACHGPMGRHPDDRLVRAEPMGPERCTGCHDAANSPDFDYLAYLPRATCQGGAPELHPL